MAVITVNDLEDLRRRAARNKSPNWTKPQINAALQAIEDAMISTSNVGARSIKAQIGQAVEAVAAGVFNAAQKDELFVLWCMINAKRGGIL